VNENVLYNRESAHRGEVLDSTHAMLPEQALAALKKEDAQLKHERDILKRR